MHKIKEMLMNELYEYEEKAKRMSGGKISVQELDKIHKLTDTVKNIDKIEMLEGDEGYSEDGHYMGEGRIYGTSYARGRRNARRDSMGRYSRDNGMSYDGGSSYARNGMRDGRTGYSRDGAKDHMMSKLGAMMEDADPNEREILKDAMRKIEKA
jgi:hypothetical protein